MNSNALPLLGFADASARCLRDDTSEWLSVSAVTELAFKWRDRLPRTKSLVFLYIPNTVSGVVALLGALAAGHAVALLDPKLPEKARKTLEQLYLPEIVITEASLASGYVAPDRPQNCGPIGTLNAILLSTSGSTGSPKFVRHSLFAITANADSIADVLDIQPSEVGCGHLPLHYSYGLSVFTSHMRRGAPVMLTELAITDRAFWARARQEEIAHLPGVPFHFQTLHRLGFRRLGLSKLRVLTQAGGALDVGTRHAAHNHMTAIGGRFHVMYGQTEAAPRITTLSHDDFTIAPASVGTALPGGEIKIVSDHGEELNSGEQGNVVYYGPNVMLGYAESRKDLESEDVNHGRLETGDIGMLDDAGRLTLAGRAKRQAKVFGLRVNLDELERIVGENGDVAVIEHQQSIIVFYKEDEKNNASQFLLSTLTAHTNLPISIFRFLPIEALPKTTRGKTDYQALEGYL